MNVFDKYQFTQNLKILKFYNETRTATRRTAPYVFVTDHLQKELQKQKRELIPLFKAARKNKQKTEWKLLDSEYCLFIEGIRVLQDNRKPTNYSRSEVDAKSNSGFMTASDSESDSEQSES